MMMMYTGAWPAASILIRSDSSPADGVRRPTAWQASSQTTTFVDVGARVAGSRTAKAAAFCRSCWAVLVGSR